MLLQTQPSDHSLDQLGVPDLETIPAYLRWWAEHTPKAPALSDNDRHFDYQQLLTAVQQMAQYLRNNKVNPGDRVVVVGANTWQWAVTYLGTLWSGAVIVPTNSRLSAHQFAAQADLVDAKVVFFDTAFESLVSLTSQPIIQMDRDDEFPVDISRRAGSFSSPAPEDNAVISFTSGTTGTPKGAVLTHRAIAEGSKVFVKVLGTSSRDSTTVLVPLFHNTGFIDQLGHMLIAGGYTRLLRQFRTKDAVEELATRPVSFITAVPSILRLLMVHEQSPRIFSTVRKVLYGGSPMPEAWSQEMMSRWPHLELFHGYGLTEFTSAVSFLRPNQASHSLESVGTAAPEVHIRILDDKGNESSEKGGEIHVKGPTCMMEYWRSPELTAQKFREGWLATGDLGYVKDGLLYLDGRVDDVINRGGEKILPAFVESLLSQLPTIAEACVFGLPDPVLQQRVHAAITARPGTEVDENLIRDFLTEKLPDYAVPETYTVLADLPRGASGKVDRRATASTVANQRTQNNGDIE